LSISRGMVATMHPEALVALKSIKDWKSSEAIRRAHGSFSAYHDVLTELHAAGVIKFKGEDFMQTGTEKDGADYGLEMHAKWIRAGKPGKFSDFIKAEKQREIFENTPGLKEQFGSFEAYRGHVDGGMGR
jgi:hypothetical protein